MRTKAKVKTVDYSPKIATDFFFNGRVVYTSGESLDVTFTINVPVRHVEYKTIVVAQDKEVEA